ncbi:MAG: hypothetical protein B6D44_11030, partial [Ignavibacteriales bacterium UTCHB2]
MMYLYFLLGIFLGTNAGIIIFSLVIKNKITCLEDKLAASRKRIERQTSIIFTMRKELVEAKGAAASEETCADLLMRMKDDLQKDYDQLLAEHKELMTEYK